MNKHNKTRIPILSFYSGGGFMDMGFEQAGFDIVWTNEIDITFIKLHSAGITSWRKSIGNKNKAEIFNTKSIAEIHSNEIIKEAFPKGKPMVFGIIGGPPCQDFSIQGNMKGFEGERGKLTTIFFDRILELQPTFFVMENVPGLTRNESTKTHLFKLLEKLEGEYYLDFNILNALEYGVAQHRERVFFVGIRKDKSHKSFEVARWFKWPKKPNRYNNAETKYNWPKPTDFGQSIVKSKELPIELCVENCLVPRKEIHKTKNAAEFFNIYKPINKLSEIKEGETNRPSFKRLHRFKFSPTACYGNNEVHLHPYEHRRLSVREALRIQGVPDSYVLPSELPLTKKFKMIGNGVPVPLARALAVSLKIFLRTEFLL